MRALRALLAEGRQLLLGIPHACYLCGRALAAPILPWSTPPGQVHNFFCEACLGRVAWVTSPRCAHCGRPGQSGRLCRICRTNKAMLQGRSLAVYTGVMKRLLTDLKYRGCRELAAPLGWLAGIIAGEVVKDWRSFLLAPIPLHDERLRERGYNQAALLAAPMTRMLKCALPSGILVRTKATTPQSMLSADERWRNVAGAFEVTKPAQVARRRFLLVDDVHTTGATLAAAATALMRVGAREVRFVTVGVAVSLKDMLDLSGSG